ncbi:hypothetical protein CC1G_03375 [Coprinopsis cinerea okayama7|uniref:Uncharacterized protein n=1 Tax=Coprinopsis cinerea (strain Okayama-7 / 130 / ATCC MYA-4618 / FGSC 9003) TaxID=240176 RepID=A8NR07_COPC7|nr:hypothetical protein CC1G_03375 [Coprinopsis cinerea okayama7\|eukprot:XP_001835593.2 hypothetical protein CC1G_03375 [Coprinopsis cinerea okayama7\
MTKGYKVYRYNNTYHVQVCNERVHPWGLGLEILAEVPRHPEDYASWLEATRATLAAAVSDSQVPSSEELASLPSFVTTDEPHNSLDVDWIFELDLDHEVFLIDSQPFFNLRSLPPPQTFLAAISTDNFGHRALHPHTPLQYRYNWASPPGSNHRSTSSPTNARIQSHGQADIADILNIPRTLQKAEDLTLSLFSTLVGCAMYDHDIGRLLRRLDLASDATQITPVLSSLAFDLVNLCISTFNQVTSGSSMDGVPKRATLPMGWEQEGYWLRQDVFLKLATHLDAEAWREACIINMVNQVSSHTEKMGQRMSTPFYVILFSLFHCVIIQISQDDITGNFTYIYTPALPFLPSFYAQTTITPGIETLSRLGFWLNRTAPPHSVQGPRNTKPLVSSTVSKLPVEVWLHVADYLGNYEDLKKLEYLTPQSLSASKRVLQYPRIGGYRITSTLSSSPPSNPLFTASFLAVSDETSESVKVEIGPVLCDIIVAPSPPSDSKDQQHTLDLTSHESPSFLWSASYQLTSP